MLGLLAGRGWSQSKVAPKKLIVETPSATAAIRGTDWELSVDDQGAATLTVLSGEVEFYNDLGTVLVSTNQQARAEIGKPPVKLLISNPADRVQWVTAYTVDPLRSVYLNSPADMGRWDDARVQWPTALAADPNDGPAASSFFTRAEAASLPRDERHMARLGRASAAIQSEDSASGTPCSSTSRTRTCSRPRRSSSVARRAPPA